MVHHATIRQVASRVLDTLRGWMSAGLLLAPALLLAGCFADLKQTTVHPESDTTRVVQDVYKLVTWIDSVIFIFVLVLLLWAVFRYRRRVVLQNLRRSFPAMPEKEIRHTARRFYGHLADVMMESVKMLTLTAAAFNRRCRVT